MNELARFERQLRELIGDPTELRPFVCQGSPLGCDAVIVGVHPATPMAAGFWDFWEPGRGFDKERWLRAYREDRVTRPLRPPKKRRTALSATRRNIEVLIAASTPIRWLETNVYSTATESFLELEMERLSAAPFDFLLKAVRPPLIVAHGKIAIDHLRSRPTHAHVIEVTHLSRGWSTERLKSFGSELRERFASGKNNALIPQGMEGKEINRRTRIERTKGTMQIRVSIRFLITRHNKTTRR